MGEFLKRKKFFMTMEDKTMKKHGSLRMNIKWIGSDGRKHLISDIDINYIRNCVNKVKRDPVSNDRVKLLPHLENELIYREILKEKE